MAISEATALARARAVRASFPKGPISVAQARAMFVAIADSQVGYASGNPNWSMYGKASTWPSDSRDWNGRQVYWCALGGGAWTPAWAFGRDAALAGFGRQYPSRAYPPVGGTWTVWVLNWARSNGLVVPFNDVQSGDIVLTRWGRTGAEVDHFDIATGPRTLNMIPVIGFNTSSASASAGAGVYRALRPRQRAVAVVRPLWNDLTRIYNQQNPSQEDTLSAAEVKEIKAHVDAAEKRVLDRVDRLRAERTNAHVKVVDMLNTAGRSRNNLAAMIKDLGAKIDAIPANVISARVPFAANTSLGRLFGKDFRLGALLGYAGATFVDRDTHTEEIVDALDADTLDLGPGDLHTDEPEQPVNPQED